MYLKNNSTLIIELFYIDFRFELILLPFILLLFYFDGGVLFVHLGSFIYLFIIRLEKKYFFFFFEKSSQVLKIKMKIKKT